MEGCWCVLCFICICTLRQVKKILLILDWADRVGGTKVTNGNQLAICKQCVEFNPTPIQQWETKDQVIRDSNHSASIDAQCSGLVCKVQKNFTWEFYLQQGSNLRTASLSGQWLTHILLVCLFELLLYDSVDTLRSCRVQSTIRSIPFLGRLPKQSAIPACNYLNQW